MNQVIVNNRLDPEQLPVNESLFTLANGYLGVRGNFEEGYPAGWPTVQGTYLNGFYDTVPMCHAEKQVGDPLTVQKQLNVIDAQPLRLFVGEEREPVSPFSGRLLSHERWLDLAGGILHRRYRVVTSGGREVQVTTERLVSFVTPELFALRMTVEAFGWSGPLWAEASVDGDVANHTDDRDPRVASGHAKRLSVTEAAAESGLALVAAHTQESGLTCCCASRLLVSREAVYTPVVTDNRAAIHARCLLDRTVTLTRYSLYTDTLRHGQPVPEARRLADEAADWPFETHRARQRSYLDAFWAQSDIVVGSDPALQDGIRFNLFHLLQASGKDPHCSVSAKGLSGEGYEGHYFWDTEIYILPFFTLTHPDLARSLLAFRSQTLPAARARARELGHRQGALFPWRTISGQECSGFFPAGAAQYHISGDIAYAFVQYWLATGDLAFMASHGAEVVFETARLWLDVGHFLKGRFRIDAITGPDEYTAIVNNNYYTNVMARHNLRWAVKLRDLLAQEAPEALAALLARIGMGPEAFEACARAAEAMYLPYDEALDIHPQDDTFLQKAPWDFSRSPQDGTPLLLHYPPLTLYRHQVCKQADVVLSHFLLEEGVAESTLRNSYTYYEGITTFDSSLTACIFSIMASRLGLEQKALDYFGDTVRLDLDNTHLNTKDGLHMASMGGAWMALIFGFAGLRLQEDHLSLRPALPTAWGQLSFSLCYRGSVLKLELQRESLRAAVQGPPVRIAVNGVRHQVVQGEPVTLRL